MLEEACERLLAEAGRRRDETIASAEEEYRRAVEAVALIRALDRPGRNAASEVSEGELN
jgi:phage I-like protein